MQFFESDFATIEFILLCPGDFLLLSLEMTFCTSLGDISFTRKSIWYGDSKNVNMFFRVQ